MFLTLDFPVYFWEPEEPRTVFICNAEIYRSQLRYKMLVARLMAAKPKPEPMQM